MMYEITTHAGIEGNEYNKIWPYCYDNVVQRTVVVTVYFKELLICC